MLQDHIHRAYKVSATVGNAGRPSVYTDDTEVLSLENYFGEILEFTQEDNTSQGDREVSSAGWCSHSLRSLSVLLPSLSFPPQTGCLLHVGWADIIHASSFQRTSSCQSVESSLSFALVAGLNASLFPSEQEQIVQASGSFPEFSQGYLHTATHQQPMNVVFFQ